MKKELLLLGSLLILTQNILAGNIGIGYGVTTPIYHNNKNTYILPIVDFEYNKFFLKGGSTYGLSLGDKLIEEDNYVLSLYGMPFGGYEVKNSDMKSGYKGINDRNTYFMGGMELTYYPGIYNLQTKLAVEYGKEGGHFNLSLSRPFYVSSKIVLIPSLNYIYYDSNFINYYFGIDSSELGRAEGEKITNSFNGREAHRVGIGVLGNYRINETLSLMGFTGVTKLPKEISNSPIVDNDLIYVFGAALIYTF